MFKSDGHEFRSPLVHINGCNNTSTFTIFPSTTCAHIKNAGALLFQTEVKVTIVPHSIAYGSLIHVTVTVKFTQIIHFRYKLFAGNLFVLGRHCISRLCLRDYWYTYELKTYQSAKICSALFQDQLHVRKFGEKQ